ncbi:28S ribosomal protein S34, mitochondrial [Thrips palmi]|uniref:28S ribosomal protein S34, mitochondrial n=1 Tax=Thrips palmi TaxID=161013 RepID=A0A6P9AI95_THRPL|nr:28S ribosomal protein S34, mitochondrial [Thrips palmi]
MPYEIYGKATAFHGKTLWEILGNLRNNGVGRIVIRNDYNKRYSDPAPSWFRILKVEALPPEGKIQVLPPVVDMGEVRRVRALVENVFRGTYRGTEWLSWNTFKPDFRLIPKEEEESFTKVKRGELPPPYEITRKFHPTAPFPPLLRELIIREMKAKGTYQGEEPKLTLVVNDPNIIAEDGKQIHLGALSATECLRLYENIKKT